MMNAQNLNIPDQTNSIYLFPGEFYMSDKGEIVSTVLGSCIAIVMYCRRLGLSAICHSQLPYCHEESSKCTSCTHAFKYVNCSVNVMTDIFKKHKVVPGEIEVKVFGGSDMFGREAAAMSPIGNQNIHSAVETLKDKDLKIIACDIGGALGRKIYFNTGNGEVFVQKIRNMINNNDSIDE